MIITSVNNEKVKFWQKLQLKKYREIEKLFLVEDDHLVNEAIKKNVVKEIITTDDSLEYNVPIYVVTDKVMKTISNQVTSARVIAVCHDVKTNEIKGNIVVLDRLQDPGNLGTIIRSAVAFNFKTIVMSEDCVDIYNPKVIRASEGMIFHINIIKTNITEFLTNLDSSYTKITTDVLTGKDIKTLKVNKCAIVIGNEGEGVNRNIKEICDEVVYIKMNNTTESLNAGVAASILMYEVNNE